MGIILLGIDFKSAPIDIRERYAFNKDSIAESLRSLMHSCNLTEAVILSTCNRTEIYAVADELTEVTFILKWWQSQITLGRDDLSCHTKLLFNDEAVKHLMRTGCGIESMVIGEPQILGQLKSAYALARECGSVGSELSYAFETAFYVAKKVRSSTTLGHCPVSVAFSAVSLAKMNYGQLADKSVMILGAGSTARLVAQHLKSCQPKTIYIANRTRAYADRLAQQINGQPLSLNQVSEYIGQVDLVVCALSQTDGYVIDSTMLAPSSSALFVDLSVPRVICPSITRLPETRVYCVDDIESMLQRNQQNRQHAATTAEAIIEQQLQRYIAQTKVRNASNTIVAFRRHTEDLVHQEVQKGLNKLKNGADPEEVLTRFAYRLQNKWLHNPTVSLREASISGDNDLLDLTRTLFKIQQH